jgi:hypothetical protein
MTLSPEQILFETFQKLDDATKYRFLVRMQQSLVEPHRLTWRCGSHRHKHSACVWRRYAMWSQYSMMYVMVDVRHGNCVAPIGFAHSPERSTYARYNMRRPPLLS